MPSQYDLDIHSQILDILSNEISKSIDAEIMNRLMRDVRIDKLRKVLNKINNSNNGKQQC